MCSQFYPEFFAISGFLLFMSVFLTHHAMNSALFVFVFFLIILEAHPAPSSAGECELSYQRIPGFYPIIKEAKGKKCKAFLELPMCRGYCKTSESGIHTFPHRRQETVACALVSIKMKNYTLTDCDDGAPASIRYVEIPYGEECMCTSISKIEAQEFGKGGE